MEPRRILLGSDHTGVALRKELGEYLQSNGLVVIDIGIEEGSPLDYVDITKELIAELDPSADLAVLICGSGLGVSIAANRSSSIRAALCRNPEDARLARRQTDANVLCLGSRYITPDQAKACVDMFVQTPFKSENHTISTNKLAVTNTQHAVNGVNLIVRAIILLHDHVLLSRPTAKNKHFATDLYFLPGGHVDYNEGAISALHRELKEEMNVEATEESFIGALECSWERKGSIYHEINLVYKVEIANLTLDLPPLSTETNLEFIWCPLNKLSEYIILPKQLALIIKECTKNTGAALFLSEMISS